MQWITAFARSFGLKTTIAAALAAVSICDHGAAQDVRDEELCLEIVESADGAAREKGALVYGVLYDPLPHSIRNGNVHRLALRDLRAATGGRLPGPSGRTRAVAVHLCLQGRPEDDRLTGAPRIT
jgi:hypothetical protein